MVFCVASTAATTANKVISCALYGGNDGRTIRENQIPPAGDSHERPNRPLPESCSSDRMRVPSGSPAAANSRAKRLVESIVR